MEARKRGAHDGLELVQCVQQPLDVARASFVHHVEIERVDRRATQNGRHSADDDEIDFVLGEDADEISERHCVNIARLRQAPGVRSSRGAGPEVLDSSALLR